ncbi:DUF3828 domain-containing protein [Larkinella terrae]|uniref:DUF3828 domain-containing protein n=1 Tax=Larkinella terrae TaxID=2025311 RepID=A0A7K0EUB9_9BACT|nr:DUF3828 domain-containing protein [Larkinella terrae]MRS65101.1 DUF3828 domain-containing protein [Larkinella terrae]
MKSLLLLPFAFAILFACQQSSSTTSAATETASDSAAIADAVHGFYRWYTAFSQDTTHRVDFTDDRGSHLKLIQPKLERYLAHFKKSGFVNDEFIAGELAFYQQCSQLWQKEAVDDVPSCLDADKYFCAQDWEPAFWTTSPVRFRKAGDDRVVATLVGKSFDSPMERNISLKKENGKWLITSIECDMGIGPATTGVSFKPLTLNEKYVMAKLENRPNLSADEIARLGLASIVSEDKRNAPDAKVCLLDTVLATERGTVLVMAYDNGNETEAWLVQYDASSKIQFREPVFYADQVEYVKTINSALAGNKLTISTSTDADDKKSSTIKTWVLTDQLVFERTNR